MAIGSLPKASVLDVGEGDKRDYESILVQS